jgi:hypothetical protein
MKTTIKNFSKVLLVAITILSISIISSCSKPDNGTNGIDGKNGLNGTNGTNGTSIYYDPITISGGLNNGSVNVSSTYTILNIGTRTFNKVATNTQIEVKLRSNAYSGNFSGGATAIQYELLVDGVIGFASSNWWIYNNNIYQYMSLDSVFTGLAPGNHTVTIRARTNLGTSSGVLIDAGGYEGKIIIQEK